MPPELPILFSFRRCPYAIRARLAIAASGLLVQLREVELNAKPVELLAASPKGTVPVLVLPNGTVLEESLEVMGWALDQHDPGNWRRHGAGPTARAEREQIKALISSNDDDFKPHLDRYKYPHRFAGVDPLTHRQAGLQILSDWNTRIARGGWLLGERPSLADVALLPFVRQFRQTDHAWFDGLAHLIPLQRWLDRFLDGPELATAMEREAPWQSGDPPRLFPKGRLIHHLALAQEWRAAEQAGLYERSTRGRSLEQVGFIHASFDHQLAATHARFYADAPELLQLAIDPTRLPVPIGLEAAPGGLELFPHIHGPLPIEAVVAVAPYP